MRCCYLHGTYVSYLRAARGNMRALAAAGVELVAEPTDADFVVLHDQPHEYRHYYARHPELHDRYVVGFAVWDTTVLPRSFTRGLAFVDELWTASAFSLEVLAPLGLPVRLVPHLVEVPRVTEDALALVRTKLDHDPTRYHYYCIVNPQDPRKAVPELLSAFAAVRERVRVTEGPEAMPRLVLKLYGANALAGPMDGVEVIDAFLSDDEMQALHALCDAYVSPHRGEGWGLCLSEAMAHGNAAIATGHSGNMHFMRADNSYPVAFELRRMTPQEAAFDVPHRTTEMEWAFVDHEALVEAMLEARAARESDPRTEKARAIVDTLGLGALAEAVRAHVEALPEAIANRRPKDLRRAVEGPEVVVNLLDERGEEPSGDAAALIGSGRAFRYALACERSQRAHHVLGLPLDRRFAEIVDRRPRLGSACALWHDDGGRPFEGERRAVARTWRFSALRAGARYDVGVPLWMRGARPREAVVVDGSSHAAVLRWLLATSRQEGAATSLPAIEVVAPAVDTERFRPRDKRHARRLFGLPHDVPLVLWTSPTHDAADPPEDVLPMLRALAPALKPEERWVLAYPPSHAHVAEAVAAAVEAEGLGEGIVVLSSPDVTGLREQLFAAADVVLAPFDANHHLFDQHLLEAMACGVPQLATRFGAAANLVEPEVTGRLVPLLTAGPTWPLGPESTRNGGRRQELLAVQSRAPHWSAMRDGLRRLLDDASLRERMAEASRRKVEQRHGWHHRAAALEALWGRLLADERGHAVDASPPPTGSLCEALGAALLSPDVPLEVTERGRAWLQSGELAVPFQEDWALLDLPLLRRMLTGFAKLQGSRPIDLALLHRVLCRDGKARPFDVDRHAVWLLRQDVVQMTTAPSPGQ